MIKRGVLVFGVVMALAAQACYTQHEVEVKPLEIKPIHITIDVNVKVDRALDDFFSDIDEAETKAGTPKAGK